MVDGVKPQALIDDGGLGPTVKARPARVRTPVLVAMKVNGALVGGVTVRKSWLLGEKVTAWTTLIVVATVPVAVSLAGFVSVTSIEAGPATVPVKLTFVPMIRSNVPVAYDPLDTAQL